MGIPVYITKALAAADDDNVAQSQTPSGAGNLTLNGVAVSGGVATFDTARRVILTFAGNETGHTFVVYGTDKVSGGNAIYESIAGTTAGVVSSTRDFGTVTRVSISTAATGAIKVGTNGVGATQWISSNYHVAPVNWSIACDVSGTVNYTVQYTYDDFWTLLPGQTQADVPTAWPDPVLNSDTTDGETTFNFPITGWRVQINSGTGSVDIAGIQAGFADS